MNGLGAPSLARLALKSDDFDNSAVRVAVIDGPYDGATLSDVLKKAPISLENGACGVNPSRGCDHGTFILGMLGARKAASIPGLCPDCSILHFPLFVDEGAPRASTRDLAKAINSVTAAGATLINLSLAVVG